MGELGSPWDKIEAHLRAAAERGKAAPHVVDQVLADHARETAIATVERNTDPAERGALERSVRTTARLLPDFTADDVWGYHENTGGPTVREPAALGPIMLRLARAGVIVKTGELRRSRLARRHRDLTVWRRAD